MAVSSMVYMVIVIIGIMLSFWALSQFRFDLFVKNPGSTQAKLLHVLLSIVIGYQTAQFFISYFNWSTLIKAMFKP
ncbi:MAG: hypothetical protein A2189_03920 [Paenibacillus sp. RIFOXYA1_FULL_44_5]|nr:MAG: hypothetical protein A2189_03920 [Paenibacillus sp. RIFOXYA1_FULL_44_5]